MPRRRIDVAGWLAVTAALAFAGQAAGAVATDPLATIAPPQSQSPPSLSGTAREGSTLTASPGVWTGDEPLAYAYQWQRCAADGGGCSDITGATDPAYLLVAADVDASVRVVVTARNASGEQSASSPAMPVEGRPPRNFTPPTLAGDAVEATRLTIDVGTWGGTIPVVHAYAWQRCDAAGENCVEVPGASGKTFLLTASDIGARLRALVTGTNVAGQLPVVTPATAVVLGRPPIATSPPTISGNPVDGQRLTASRGTWTGTPTIAYTYSWQRCDALVGGCLPIAGATAQTYVLTPADVGASVRVSITAANPVGQRSESSGPVGPVAGRPPENTGAPTVTGTLAEGQRVTAATGSWVGTPPLVFSHRWQRCDAQGCSDIVGATGKSYVLSPQDAGATVRVAVTAGNVAASATALSPTSARVAASPPSPPRKITAVGSGGAVTLDWLNNPESDVLGYRVYRQAADDPWPDAPLATTTASRFVDRPPPDGRTYGYRVTAVDETALAGAPSGIVSALATGRAPLAVAAGDIACDPASTNFREGLGTTTTCRQAGTATLLGDADVVLALGDLQYDDAAPAKFELSYGLSWGRAKNRTRPAAGNHEYGTPGAAGYFDYFNGAGTQSGPAGDRAKGYYSYNLGAWHLVVLNSNCSKAGGCGAGSPQEKWLRADLAASADRCTLAYWHHPRFSGGRYGDNLSVQAFWQALHEEGAELILSGHDHNYQRYAPQDARGVADETGPREFVVGTGGKSSYPLVASAPNREVADAGTSGVLELALRTYGYDWRFQPEPGRTFTDAGSAGCR